MLKNKFKVTMIIFLNGIFAISGEFASPNATASGARSIAIGEGAITNAQDSVSLGENSRVEGAASYNFGRKSIVNGIRAYNFASDSKIEARQAYNFGDSSTLKGSHSYSFGYGTEINGDGSYGFGERIKTSKNAGGSYAIGNYAETRGKVSYAIGGTALAEGNFSYAIGFRTKSEGVSSFAIGHRAKSEAKSSHAIGTKSVAKKENSIALGSFSEATVDKEVAGYDFETGVASTNTTGVWKSTHAALSVGKADGSITRQINGVAAGMLDSDAVNVAQLKQVKSLIRKTDVVAVADSGITVEKITDGDKDTFKVGLDKVKLGIKDLSGGIATSMAIASIPQVSDRHLFSIGAGGAYYNKAGGFAIGVSGTIPNRRFIYKVSAGMDTKKTFGVAAG